MDRQEGCLGLKTTLLKPIPQQVHIDYDSELDTLFCFLSKAPVPSAACHVGEGLYALFDPETMEVVGFQIESWAKAYVQMHKEAMDFWRQTRWYRKPGTEDYRPTQQQFLQSLSRPILSGEACVGVSA